jgi:hypothetical protein
VRRIQQVADEPSIRSLIDRLVDVAKAGLPAMFDGDRHAFVHSLHRQEGGAPLRAAGESVRYGAMVALGARWLDESTQRMIFAGESAAEFMARDLARCEEIQDLGDLALVAWAASAVGCGGTEAILERLSERVAGVGSIATVELAWSLSALVEGRSAGRPEKDAESVCARLLSAFSHEAGVFPHVVGAGGGILRGHVACFADQVYPIQALSRYHAALAAPEALAAATRCAEQICGAMGPDGQWWWHYDARNGNVIEGYPVYSVHQDAMGPMALFDLQEAGGPDFSEVIRKSLGWMAEAAEVGHSLMDEDNAVIWRKVGRAEPGKLMRAIRASTSRVHSGLRLTPLDSIFRATRIDYECRPYHLGWVLDTWLAR